jgi:hypothetical protein
MEDSIMIIELDFSAYELENLRGTAAYRHYENERDFVAHVLEDALDQWYGICEFSINTWAKDDQPDSHLPPEIPTEIGDTDLDDDIPF